MNRDNSKSANISRTIRTMKAAKRFHEENTDSLTSRTLNVLFKMCFVICVPTFMMEEANSNGLNIKRVRPEETVKEKL